MNSNAYITGQGLFYKHGLTLITAWRSDYNHYEIWDEITYPFANIKGAAVEVWL